MAQEALPLREEQARRRLEASCRSGRWFPRETDQHILLAALTRLDDPARELVLGALLDTPGKCGCGGTFSLRMLRVLADLEMFCGRCGEGAPPASRIEVKPHRAARHWSQVTYDEWEEAKSLQLLRRVAGVHPCDVMPTCRPSAKCPSTCDHARHYRIDGPAIAQVVLAALDGTPVVLLSESSDSPTTQYDVVKLSGYALDDKAFRTRTIAAAIADVALAVESVPGLLSSREFDLVSYALFALWARADWGAFEELGSDVSVRSVLPPHATALADPLLLQALRGDG